MTDDHDGTDQDRGGLAGDSSPDPVRDVHATASITDDDGHSEMPQSARVIIAVTAGVIPGRAESEHTRRWGVTSERWRQAEADGTSAEALAMLVGRATGYATLLCLQPDRVNWVRTEWVWV